MNRRILLLPGYACTAGIWRSVLDDLLPLGEVVAADWPADGLDAMHRVEDLAAWLRESLAPERFDAVVGHSLGGLVALAALAGHAGPRPRVVLVETFLTPPTRFFHGVTQRDPAHDPAAAEVHAMLERERPRWSPLLALALRGREHLALAGEGERTPCAIYGDRGHGSRERVIGALAWPDALRERIPVSLVSDAAHFPMVEAPRETARALRVLLD